MENATMKKCERCGCESESGLAVVKDSYGKMSALCAKCVDAIIEPMLQNGISEYLEIKFQDGTKVTFEPDNEGN